NSDLAVERIHQTMDALLTFPFFGHEKLVWLKNVTFLSDNPAGRSAAVAAALDRLARVLSDGLPPSTHFVLSAIDVDKRRAFYKTLQKVAQVALFEQLDTSKSGWEEDAAILVRRCGEERALKFDPEALELFALFTGGDRRAIITEIEKLDLYLGRMRRQITVDDVRLLVPLSRPGIVFELGNAIVERDLSRALGILEQLLFQGESAVGLLR